MQAPDPGIDAQPSQRNDAHMKPENTPRELPPVTAAAARQLESWEKLRDELQTLHAELEYLRLMLKLNGSGPQAH